MPIFKKRSFFHHYTDVLNNTLGEAAVELLKFLKEETNYDTDLIWKSVIRTRALSDLVRCAQLNRVLPRNFLTNKVTMSEQKVGLVFHMYYENLFDENISFVLNFPSNADIFITTNSDAKKNAIKNKLAKIGREANIITIENRGCDVSSLLVGATDFVFNYDLICFMHDKKPSHVSPPSVDRSWSYKLNENMVATKEFVANVIDLFAREKWLGMAFPTAPNHSMYSSYIGDGWSGNYQNTERLLKDFGINVKINEHSLCVAPLGTCFWFRPITLKKLYMGYNGKGWSYRDFPREPNQTEQTILHAIERAYAYFAQDAGYYPVYLYNDKFTEIELTNLEFCKVGSQDMRNWMDLLVLNALGYMPNTNEPTVQITECTPPDGLTAYRQITINYGVRHALKMLAIALRIKFPHMWGALLPFRRMAKLMLRVE
jgi:rhamnosyltransferase